MRCTISQGQSEWGRITSNAVAAAMMAGDEDGALTVLFHPCEAGGFTAACIELPGCFSEGETQEEADRNIRLAPMLA